MVNNPKQLEYQFESIKSLTIETDTTILLIGTYKLLDIRDQSGQLMRRSEIIHFPRYDARITSDLMAYRSVLNSFSEHLPLAKMPLLDRHAPKFYEKTGGGIGILKDWLARGYERYLMNPKGNFDWDFLEPLAMQNKALLTIVTEALLGEEKLRDVSSDELAVLLKDGLPKAELEEGGKKKSRDEKGRHGRMAKRNPTRDPVGGAYA